MRPPRGEDPERANARRLEEISSALETGRLVELLRGKGLSKDTVRELLMPDSATNLRAILTHSMSSRQRNGECRAGGEADRGPSEGGKVLAFKSKESPGSDPAIPATREDRDCGVRED